MPPTGPRSHPLVNLALEPVAVSSFLKELMGIHRRPQTGGRRIFADFLPRPYRDACRSSTKVYVIADASLLSVPWAVGASFRRPLRVPLPKKPARAAYFVAKPAAGGDNQ